MAQKVINEKGRGFEVASGQPGPAHGSWAAPPPQGKRRRGLGKRIALWSLAVVGVLALGFGVLVALDVNDSVKQDQAIQAGQCVTVTGFGTSAADLVAAPCTDPAANYSVGTRLKGGSATCPKGGYAVFQQSARIGGDFTLCLVPNWKAGGCYLNTEKSTSQIDCTTGKGKDRIKVTKVYTGTSDAAKCTKGGFVVTFSQPATVFCFRDL